MCKKIVEMKEKFFMEEKHSGAYVEEMENVIKPVVHMITEAKKELQL